MVRATLLKLAAVLAALLELSLLPPGLRIVALTLTLLAFGAVLAWGIVSPSSSLFVASVHGLPDPIADGAIAFTFDDGPDPAVTPKVLDLLARHRAKATFFLVGSRAARYPDLVRRIVAGGHAVGSHTFDHGHGFHFGSPRRQREEIERGIDAIRAITGEAPRLFRPPQGLRTPLLRDALARRSDLLCVTWTERGLDAMGRPARAIVARLAPKVRAGAILTLHDGAGLGGSADRTPTLEALAQLLDLAAERGLRCVSLAALERIEHVPSPAVRVTS